MFRRLATLACGVVVACASLSFAHAAEKRIALVIGNGDYVGVPDLRNPPNDARAMAAALRKADFEVIEASDLDQRGFKRSVRDLAERLAAAGPDSVALVYYAGHGIQRDGVNYLVPVDAKIDRESDIPIESVSLDDVLAALDAAASRMRVVILDACRDNPFAAGSRSAGRGLALVGARGGTLIAYATAPGMTAVDGEGANSPYTEALVEAMATPGLEIEQVFKKVRVSVHEATDGKQTPWETSSLTGNFAFTATGVVAEAPDQNSKADETAAVAKRAEAADDIGALTRVDPAARVELLAVRNGGTLVAAPSDAWARVNDSAETIADGLAAGEEAVFAFRDGRPATFDSFAVLVPGISAKNPRRIEISAANDGPDGPFQPIGTMELANGLVPGSPYQTVTFDPVTARFFRVRLLEAQGAPLAAIAATEMKLYGKLGAEIAASAPQPAPAVAAAVRHVALKPVPSEVMLGKLEPEVVYEFVIGEDSIELYELFMALFAGDPLAAKIAAALGLKLDALAFEAAKFSAAPEAYAFYLASFPGGIHAVEALKLSGAASLDALPKIALANLGKPVFQPAEKPAAVFTPAPTTKKLERTTKTPKVTKATRDEPEPIVRKKPRRGGRVVVRRVDPGFVDEGPDVVIERPRRPRRHVDPRFGRRPHGRVVIGEDFPRRRHGGGGFSIGIGGGGIGLGF